MHPRRICFAAMLKQFLRRQAQSFAYRLLLRNLPKPYEHVGGYCWRSRLPRSLPKADSTLLLFEDRRYLGPANSRRKHVESIGRGWYRHDDEVIYFSTPDNTDPNTNRREYSYSVSSWLHTRNSGVANNLLHREVTDSAIASDVEYALAGSKYRNVCHEFGIHDLVDKSILELGPGPSCAWALLMACYGASVSVVDPYPATWDASYHPVFLSAFRNAVADLPGTDVSPISDLLEEQDFSEHVICRHEEPVELLEMDGESFDIVFSNAVGEHFFDCTAAFKQLHRVTKTGGWGFHWIDFRDHRDFQTPLEYLSMSDAEFAREFGLRRGEIGNRWRANEMSAVIEQAGFEVVRREPTIQAESTYLEAFIPRLRASGSSRYRDIPAAELQRLGELVVLRKH